MRYENIVLNTEDYVRKLLDRINEPWDEGVLKHQYHDHNLHTKRDISDYGWTDERANQKIYDDCIGQWKLILTKRELKMILGRSSLNFEGNIYPYLTSNYSLREFVENQKKFRGHAKIALDIDIQNILNKFNYS